MNTWLYYETSVLAGPLPSWLTVTTFHLYPANDPVGVNSTTKINGEGFYMTSFRSIRETNGVGVFICLRKLLDGEPRWFFKNF